MSNEQPMNLQRVKSYASFKKIFKMFEAKSNGPTAEEVAQRCSIKKVFLKFTGKQLLQILFFLMKLQVSGLQLY